jgi:hypothetical protein
MLLPSVSLEYGIPVIGSIVPAATLDAREAGATFPEPVVNWASAGAGVGALVAGVAVAVAGFVLIGAGLAGVPAFGLAVLITYIKEKMPRFLRNGTGC